MAATSNEAPAPLAGLPNFLRFEPSEEDKRLRALNELARVKGWESALHEIFASDPGFIRYVTDPVRQGFLELLPVTSRSDVLEIGPGLGQFTVPLARMARSVKAIEVAPLQAEFVAERCRQQGLSNVEVMIGGDDCRLPYADASFDVIVLNLVFEWCASRLEQEPHEAAQRRLLQEMSRVARPGAALYLATKNRYAMRLLFGGADEHLYQLPFGSALPRALAGWLIRRKGHGRAMGQLYSHRALEKMLRDAGFAATRSFWAVPEMRYPAAYIPTDARSVRAARRQQGWAQGEGRITRTAMRWVPAQWVKHVTPGLSFLATKPAK
ncbi:MAG TPA: class I SAM-dependent methyltransferase [Albitalea sp.]|nr:class I SAM-dependent methyltransferase [Albitalea sp.]